MKIDTINADRGTGRTTRQMQSAPIGAVFVWCSADVSYPRALANKIGRTDLKILPADRLADDSNWYRGEKLTGVVLDHAAVPDEREWRNLQQAMARIR